MSNLNDLEKVEQILKVSAEQEKHRLLVCQSCEYFSPEGLKTVSIIDAVTGLPTSSTVMTYNDCTRDSITLTGFLQLKNSICPEGKW